MGNRLNSMANKQDVFTKALFSKPRRKFRFNAIAALCSAKLR